MLTVTATQYSLKDRAFDVFFAGCLAPHCPGCHNPDLQTFDLFGKPPIDVIQHIVQDSLMIDRVRLMGGEPLDQDTTDMLTFILDLRAEGWNGDIWLFTKYLPEELRADQKEVCKHVQYIKHGRYIQNRPPHICPDTGIKLGSDNQFVLVNNKQ